MFYMPKYHNLPDGRQVFLRFPDPARHAQTVKSLLGGIPEDAEAFLAQTNAHPMRLVLVAEIANQPVGCGLLSLEEPVHRQAAVEEAFRGLGLEQLMETALAEVAAQKGVTL